MSSKQRCGIFLDLWRLWVLENGKKSQCYSLRSRLRRAARWRASPEAVERADLLTSDAPRPRCSARPWRHRGPAASRGRTVPGGPASARGGRGERYLQAGESECISPEKLSRRPVGSQPPVAVATGCRAKTVGGGRRAAPGRSGRRASAREPASRARTPRRTRPAASPWPPCGTLWAGPHTVSFLPERSCRRRRSTPRARPRASPRRRSEGRRGTWCRARGPCGTWACPSAWTWRCSTGSRKAGRPSGWPGAWWGFSWFWRTDRRSDTCTAFHLHEQAKRQMHRLEKTVVLSSQFSMRIPTRT